MAFHTLKTDPHVFEANWEMIKQFEIRLNDRDFQIGDELCLRETTHSGAEIKAGAVLRYTGRATMATICFILQGYGLQDNWCILQLAEIMQVGIGEPNSEI